MMNQTANDDWPIYAVHVTRIGNRRSQVFALFRQVLGINPLEAKALLDSPRTEVARGPRMLVESVALQFKLVGAEVEITVASDEMIQTPFDLQE